MFYIYAYLRKDGTPYYIGKGSGTRAWNDNGTRRVHKPRDRSKIVIMERELTLVGSLALERFYIRWYGRKDIGTGILHNMSDGGEGPNGYKHSEERKRKISEFHTGRKRKPFTEDHIINLVRSRTGKGCGERNAMASPENRKKVGLSKIGRKRVYMSDGSFKYLRAS